MGHMRSKRSSNRFRGITDITTDGYCTNHCTKTLIHLFHYVKVKQHMSRMCVWGIKNKFSGGVISTWHVFHKLTKTLNEKYFTTCQPSICCWSCELCEGNRKIRKHKIENKQLSTLCTKFFQCTPFLGSTEVWIICCAVDMFCYRASKRRQKSLCFFAPATNFLKQWISTVLIRWV